MLAKRVLRTDGYTEEHARNRASLQSTAFYAVALYAEGLPPVWFTVIYAFVYSVTEVCGEAGAGKTQLMLHLMIRCQYSKEQGGLGRKAVYVCTEGEPPMKRLRQIADSCKDEILPHWKGAHPCDNIFIEKAHTPPELEYVIESRLPHLLELHSPGLVIIDSIAAPLRGDEAYQGYQESALRSEFLMKISRLLKCLATRFNCAIVTVNQVTDSFSPSEDQSYTGRKGTKQASLGLTWSQGVNARLILLRPTMNDDDLIDENDEENNPDFAQSLQMRRADISSTTSKGEASVVSMGASRFAKIPYPTAPLIGDAGICEFRIGSRGLESDEASNDQVE
eukprot:762521-Hanusia_phi.AAC.12